jgi:hypothetical protein
MELIESSLKKIQTSVEKVDLVKLKEIKNVDELF